MVFFTSILAMACVYYGYDRGLVIGFMVALFCEILSLVLLYNLLKGTEERMHLRLTPLIEEQRERLKRMEGLAEKRGLALDALVRSQPESAGLVFDYCGEHFPRETGPPPAEPEKAGEASSP